MKIVLPFQEQTLVEILTNKLNTTYIIDGKASIDNLGSNLCLYIANLNLQCDIDCEDLTYEQRVELIDQYLSLLKVCNIKSLTETLLNILWVYCGCGFNINGCTASILTEDETNQYIQTHADVLERIIISLYSIVALIIEQGKQQGKIDVDIEYEVVNDRYFTPINFVNLFDYPDLILCYGKLEFNKIKYLQYQFDAPIFSNKYLGDYVFNKNNLISVFVVNLLNGFN